MEKELKRKIWILGGLLIYVCLTSFITYLIGEGNNDSGNFILAWLSFAVSAGLTYGYYALYRDIKLFGFRWIKDTFKQLFKI